MAGLLLHVHVDERRNIGAGSSVIGKNPNLAFVCLSASVLKEMGGREKEQQVQLLGPGDGTGWHHNPVSGGWA